MCVLDEALPYQRHVDDIWARNDQHCARSMSMIYFKSSLSAIELMCDEDSLCMKDRKNLVGLRISTEVRP